MIKREKCPAEEEISMLVDGELGEKAKGEVLDHIKTCDKCEKVYERLKNLNEVLKVYGKFGFDPRLMQRTSECPDEETMAAFFDGTLSKRERAKILEHISKCNYCFDVVNSKYQYDEEFAKVPVKGTGVETAPVLQGWLDRAAGFFVVIRKFFQSPPVRVTVPVVASLLVVIGVLHFFSQRKISPPPVTVPEGEVRVEPSPRETGAQPEKIREKPAEKVPVFIPRRKPIVHLPIKDFSQVETFLLASAEMEPAFHLRGKAVPSAEKFSKELKKLNLEVLKITPEMQEILLERMAIHPVIERLKKQEIIGETKEGFLANVDAKAKLATEEQHAISQENLARQKLLDVYTQQYINSEKLSLTREQEVKRGISKCLTEVFHTLTLPGEMLQLPDGRWAKKESP